MKIDVIVECEGGTEGDVYRSKCEVTGSNMCNLNNPSETTDCVFKK